MEQFQAKCKVCSNNSVVIAKKLHGYQEGVYFDIFYCKVCDTSYVNYDNEKLSEAIYNSIYANGKEVPGYVRYHEYGENVLRTKNKLEYLADSEDMYWAVKKSIKQGIIKKSMKIMEVGCGLGYLTYALANEGFNILGVDISEKAINNAIEKYGNLYRCLDIYKMAEKGEEKFDIIILTEVIEHVSRPIDFIEALSKLLNSGGKIILTTPNKSAYPDNVYWDTELPPVHLFWFSEQSIENITSQLNLSCDFIDFSEYNKDHLDRTRLKGYKEGIRYSILNSDGKVIGKKPKIYKRKILSLLLKLKIIKLYSLIMMSMKGNKESLSRRQTMCAILSKY